jgi:hypothetical protein
MNRTHVLPLFGYEAIQTMFLRDSDIRMPWWSFCAGAAAARVFNVCDRKELLPDDCARRNACHGNRAA